MLEKIGRAVIPYLLVFAQLHRERLYKQVAREARRTARRTARR
jgi:hypothetical protein